MFRIEGVETQEQALFLMQCECERAQEYHFRRPVTAEEFEKLLQLGHGSPKYDLRLPKQLNL